MDKPWYIIPQTQFNKKHAIVIGGGLAGTSAAYSLAKRGWHVKLIERTSLIAGQASGNPFGIVTPLVTHKQDPIGEFYRQGFQYSLQHFKELNGVSYNNCGVIELAKNKISKNIEETILQGSNVRNITSSEATDLAGINISSPALYMPDGGFISPASVCKANIESNNRLLPKLDFGESDARSEHRKTVSVFNIRADLRSAATSKLTAKIEFREKSNIEILLNQDALSLRKSHDEWIVTNQTGQELAGAPVVVVANAADAKRITQCNFIPLHSVRGQLTYLPADNINLNKVLCYDGGYIIPQTGELHYVGATYSRNNMDNAISLQNHIENIENLRKIIDIGTIDYQELDGRVAFRASLPDRRPVIGAVPDINAFIEDYADLKHGRKRSYKPGKYLSGLYISSGYGSRGLTACPIGGEIIAAMINNEEPPIAGDIINILSPARFVINKLIKGYW